MNSERYVDEIEDERPFGMPAMDSDDGVSIEIMEDLSKAVIENTEQLTDRKQAKSQESYILKSGTIINLKMGIAFPDVEIDTLGLSARAHNCLRRNGYHMLSDIISLDDEALESMRNAGKKTIQEIKEKLIKYMYLSNAPSVPQKELQKAEEKKVITLKTSISELGLSVRAYNALCRHGIQTVGQLIEYSTEDLKKIRNAGAKTIDEIKKCKEKIVTSNSFDNSDETEYNFIVEKFVRDFSKHSKDEEILSASRTYAMIAVSHFENNENAISELYYNERLRNLLLNSFVDFLCEHYPYGAEKNITMDFFSECVPQDVVQSILDETTEKTPHDELILKTINWEDTVEELFPDKFEFYINVLQKRLNGVTLSAIADEFNITRERVRQIESKLVRNIKKYSERNSIDLCRYQMLLGTYEMDAELFHIITEEPIQNYHLIEKFSSIENAVVPIEKMADDEKVPEWMKCNLREHQRKEMLENYILIEKQGILIPKKRSEIIRFVLSRYAVHAISFDEFWNIYHDFLHQNGLDDERYLFVEENERRSQENQITRVQYRYAISSFHSKIRYYNIDSHDYTELFETLNLSQYHNIEISTLKFFRDYPELMREYDICDEYELHNLLKKLGFGQNDPSIDMKHMPHILFGEFDRDAAIKEIMFELAPVSIDELSEYISFEYGYKTDTMKATYFKNIMEYYHNGIFSVDYEEMPEKEMEQLSALLTEPFYELKEIKRIYKRLFPNSDEKLISFYNLKKLGFVVNSTYAVRGYKSASEYFETLLTEKDIIDIAPHKKRMGYLQIWRQTCDKLKSSYTIIEFEPQEFINIRILNRLGITVDDLRTYCDKVLDFTEEGEFFTIDYLKNKGFEDDLDELGFSSVFYASILFEDKRFSHQKFGKNVLFYHGECNISTAIFVKYLMQTEDALDIDDLIEDVKEQYGILLDKDRLKDSISDANLYYNDVMQRIYPDYESYLDELRMEEEI